MLGLRCRAGFARGAASGVCSRGAASAVCSQVVVPGPLVALVALVPERGPWGVRAPLVVAGLGSCSSQVLGHRLSSCGAQAWLLRGVRDPRGSGI